MKWTTGSPAVKLKAVKSIILYSERSITSKLINDKGEI